VGDEIEAVFGIPVPFEDHADAALHAALDMRRALEVLNAERSAQGKPTFAHGIGAHSGDVLAGNSGSEDQSAYALIGNTVNIASRIQELTKELECDILASQETVERLKEVYPLEAYAPRPIKGYSKMIIVHRIIH
jgi:class 3 adenylate cyclase